MATAKTTTNTTDSAESAGKGIRNFKQNNDIESFYRFVHENGLRREASIILTKVMTAMGATKKKKGKKRRKSAKKTLQ